MCLPVLWCSACLLVNNRYSTLLSRSMGKTIAMTCLYGTWFSVVDNMKANPASSGRAFIQNPLIPLWVFYWWILGDFLSCPQMLLAFNHTARLSSVSYWSRLALMLKLAYKNKSPPTNVHKQFKNQLYKLLKQVLFAMWKCRAVCKDIFPAILWCVNICYCFNY